MKNLAKIAIALTTVVSCAAFAQTSTDADQARRDRNMNEVLTQHHVDVDRMDSNVQQMPQRDSSVKSSAHHAAEKTREETHKVAQSTRNFTHKHLQKLRAFSARQDAAFQAKNNRPAEKTTAGEASKS
jgi:hypothetical protein